MKHPWEFPGYKSDLINVAQEGSFRASCPPTPPMVTVIQGLQSPVLAAAASLSFHSRSCWIWFPSFGDSEGAPQPWPWNTLKMHWKYPKMHWNTLINALKCPNKHIIQVQLSRKKQPSQNKYFSGNKWTPSGIEVSLDEVSHVTTSIPQCQSPPQILAPAAPPSHIQPRKMVLDEASCSWRVGVCSSSLCSFEHPTDWNTWMINFKVGRGKRRNPSLGEVFEQIGNNKQKKSGRKSWDPMP